MCDDGFLDRVVRYGLILFFISVVSIFEVLTNTYSLRLSVEQIIAMFFLLTAFFADGVRDNNSQRICDRLPWHMVKYYFIYGASVTILLLADITIFPWWSIMAILCYLFWKWGNITILPGNSKRKSSICSICGEVKPTNFSWFDSELGKVRNCCDECSKTLYGIESI